MNDKLPVNCIKHIAEFLPAEDCLSVAVLVAADDEWSATKAIELIAAAPQMYDVLNDLLCQPDQNQAEMLQRIHRAIAAAKGAMLQKDRMASK